MRRMLAIAVPLAGLVLPLCLHAQYRSASHATIFRAIRPYRGYATAPRSLRPVRPTRPAPPRGYPVPFPQTGSRQSLIDYGQSACLLNPSYAGSFYCRQFFPGRPSWGFEPVVLPYWFPSQNYESEPAPAPAVEPDNQLATQVANLANEVELLQEDQAARTAPAPPVAAPTVEAPKKPPATLLVYRDGHRVEVQNYALLGQTLWVFSDQSTRRIGLADLDLVGTERANEQRGVDFIVPNLR
jgi:hypothetical protein